MASRDSKGGGGGNRGVKILSRDDRDSDRGGRDGRRDRDRRRGDDRDRRREREQGDGAPKLGHGPIVLLKRPDGRASSNDRAVGVEGSASSGVSSSSHSENVGSKAGPTMILQRSARRENEDHPEKAKVGGPPAITELLKPMYQFPGGKAMKLIDSNMKMCPWKSFEYDANNYLGNLDYLVITAIGRPNVGKSSILSYLGGNEKFGTRQIFLPRKREEEMQTSIYITSDQMVLIEMSPIFNQAATSELIPLVSQQGVLEISNVTWNLRLVRWALSVSHVILVVSENVFEPSVFQLMNSAEIIHSMDSALGEGSYPEPVYVCNKATLELLDKTESVNEFRKYFTSVTGRTPRISTNYFLLPHSKYEMEHRRFKEFKNCILEFNRYNRAPFAADREGLVKISQKNNIQDWFQNATRLWDEMNQPSYFSSYVKLLP